MNPRKSIEELRLANSKNLGRALRRAPEAAAAPGKRPPAEGLRLRLREHWNVEVAGDEAERYARALEALSRDPSDAAAAEKVGDLWQILRENDFGRFGPGRDTPDADAEIARFARGDFEGEGEK